jgi:hypothetical protein
VYFVSKIKKKLQKQNVCNYPGDMVMNVIGTGLAQGHFFCVSSVEPLGSVKTEFIGYFVSLVI